MTITTETKKAFTCLVIGVGLAWVIVWLVNREKKSSDEKDIQPIVTDESVTVAVNAYKSGLDAKESKENMDEINNELKEEFGLTVEFKPLDNKFIVRDLSGKKVKEV